MDPCGREACRQGHGSVFACLPALVFFTFVAVRAALRRKERNAALKRAQTQVERRNSQGKGQQQQSKGSLRRLFSFSRSKTTKF
jgi:hypothetical protein